MTPRNWWARLMGDRVTVDLAGCRDGRVFQTTNGPLVVVALTPEQAYGIEHVVPGISKVADVALDDAATGGSWG